MDQQTTESHHDKKGDYENEKGIPGEVDIIDFFANGREIASCDIVICQIEQEIR
ncbi:MAG: hypothetical protein HYZ25_05345 [Chloroflexi bacterium]|nr:hypothetical protein [Chloroflexota bacterium]